MSLSQPLVQEAERKGEGRKKRTELFIAATYPKELGWNLPRSLPKKDPQPERTLYEFR